MPPRDNPSPKTSMGPAAAGHFAVALLALAVMIFEAASWPSSPPNAHAAVPPMAWTAWALSLGYLAATVAWHVWLAIVSAQRTTSVGRHAALCAIVPLPVVVATAWILAIGPTAKALLFGLGDAFAALLVASAVSMLWLLAAPALVRSALAEESPPRQRDWISLLLAVVCLTTGIAVASTLAWTQWGGAASPR